MYSLSIQRLNLEFSSPNLKNPFSDSLSGAGGIHLREMLKLWRPQWIRTASAWPPSSFFPLAPRYSPARASPPSSPNRSSQPCRRSAPQLNSSFELLFTQCRYFHPHDLPMLRDLSAQLQLTFPKMPRASHWDPVRVRAVRVLPLIPMMGGLNHRFSVGGV
jgi:hypothetical protein